MSSVGNSRTHKGPIPQSNDLERVFKELFDIWHTANARWDTYRALYMVSEDQIGLLNWAAPDFFSMVQNTMLDEIVLTLCRVLDPVGKGDRECLVLKQLEKHVPSGISAQKTVDQKLITYDVKEELNDLLEQTHDVTESLRRQRNKRIAHNDFKLCMQGIDNLGYSYDNIIEAFSGIKDVLELVNLHYYKDHYIASFGGEKFGKKLARRLRQAKAFEDMREEGLVDHARWLRVLSGNPDEPGAKAVEDINARLAQSKPGD